jgi:hypothetical protein
VLIHGWNSHPGVADPRASLTNAGIALAGSPKAARDALAGAGIVYAPLDSLDPALLDLLRLRLREKLGLRSAVNTALRAWNPGGARASVQGAPPYRPLARDAAEALGQQAMIAIKGGGGELERRPGKSVTLEGLIGGQQIQAIAPPLIDKTQRLSDWGRQDRTGAPACALGQRHPRPVRRGDCDRHRRAGACDPLVLRLTLPRQMTRRPGFGATARSIRKADIMPRASSGAWPRRGAGLRPRLAPGRDRPI